MSRTAQLLRENRHAVGFRHLPCGLPAFRKDLRIASASALQSCIAGAERAEDQGNGRDLRDHKSWHPGRDVPDRGLDLPPKAGRNLWTHLDPEPSWTPVVHDEGAEGDRPPDRHGEDRGEELPCLHEGQADGGRGTGPKELQEVDGPGPSRCDARQNVFRQRQQKHQPHPGHWDRGAEVGGCSQCGQARSDTRAQYSSGADPPGDVASPAGRRAGPDHPTLNRHCSLPRVIVADGITATDGQAPARA